MGAAAGSHWDSTYALVAIKARNESADDDGEEKPERLVALVDGRRVAEELLVDEEEPEEVGVLPLGEDDPGERNGQEDEDAGGGDRPPDLAVPPRKDEPHDDHRGREDGPDEPLGQEREPRRRIGQVQVAPARPPLRPPSYQAPGQAAYASPV